MLLATFSIVPGIGLVYPRADRQTAFFRDYQLPNTLPGVNLKTASETLGSSGAGARRGYVKQSRDTTYSLSARAVPSEIATAACEHVMRSLAIYGATVVEQAPAADIACLYRYKLGSSDGMVQVTAKEISPPGSFVHTLQDGTLPVKLFIRIDENWYKR